MCKKVLLKEEILDFFKHKLILTKCLVPCMFELTDVYYINLISIILPSRCFLFKIFLRSSKLINKTKDYIFINLYIFVIIIILIVSDYSEIVLKHVSV